MSDQYASAGGADAQQHYPDSRVDLLSDRRHEAPEQRMLAAYRTIITR